MNDQSWKAKNILVANQDFSRDKYPNFDFHLHTNWTDGKNTVQEMYSAALKFGLSHILFSEHARSTSDVWFLDFVAEVKKCQNDSCKAWVGVETKILNFEGDLDISSTILDKCDLVMASVRRFPNEEGIIDKNTDQFTNALNIENPIKIEFDLANMILENPSVDILGHPFGMSYKRFNLIPPQHMMLDLIKKAAKTGVAFEINSRYHPNLWELIDTCKKYGAIISLGSNAHSIDEVGKIINQLKNEVVCATT